MLASENEAFVFPFPLQPVILPLAKVKDRLKFVAILDRKRQFAPISWCEVVVFCALAITRRMARRMSRVVAGQSRQSVKSLGGRDC